MSALAEPCHKVGPNDDAFSGGIFQEQVSAGEYALEAPGNLGRSLCHFKVDGAGFTPALVQRLDECAQSARGKVHMCRVNRFQ
jgi:hypothetical protein